MPQDTIPLSDASLRGYEAARGSAGLIIRPDRGRIVVSGRDRATFLQGLLTNDVLALGPGHGCYAAYLTPQGRMTTDLWVYELGDVMLLVMNGERKDALLARLDQLVFTEDVQLGDVTDTFGAAAVVGPDAADVVSRVTGIGSEELAALPEHGNMRRELDGRPIILLQAGDLGQAGYEVLVEAPQLTALAAALRQAGAAEVDAAAAEALRVEAGIPRFGVDMDEETIPLEAGIESRALSFTKGCYVGQEVIIRVLHRGHGRVARRLVGMVADGPVGRGAPVRADAKDVGEVTSSTFSPRLEKPIALGYVHRDFRRPARRWPSMASPAVVSAVPFQRSGGRQRTFYVVSVWINSASAGGKSSSRSSSAVTQRISCPCCGTGSPSIAQRRKCSSTRPIVDRRRSSRGSSAPTTGVDVELLASSRAMQAFRDSPGSHLPPGNSQ